MNSFDEKSARAAFGNHQELLLQKYAPPCLLINQQEKILLMNGAIEKYLPVSNKIPGSLLSDFVDENIYQDLSKGIREVVQGEESVLIDGSAFDVLIPFYVYISLFIPEATTESLILIEFEGMEENANNTMHSLPVSEMHQKYEALFNTTEHDIRNLTNNFIMLLKLEDTHYSVDNKIHDVKEMQAQFLSNFKKNLNKL